MSLAVISLGSNISPEAMIAEALELLALEFDVIAKSSFVKTSPIGMLNQPDFINGCVLINTGMGIDEFKKRLNNLEAKLGRIKQPDKFAPRTIDFDIIVWDNSVINNDFYERLFIKKAVLELIPCLKY